MKKAGFTELKGGEAMQGEAWSDYLRYVVITTVLLAIESAVAGVVWGLALGFYIGTGAMWGAIIGGGIALISSLWTLRRRALALSKINTRKATLLEIMNLSVRRRFRGLWAGLGRPLVIVIVVGLIVCLVRTLVG